MAIPEEEIKGQVEEGQRQTAVAEDLHPGFYFLFQQLNDLRDHLDTKIDTQIGGLRTELKADINRLDAKIDTKSDGLRGEFVAQNQFRVGTFIGVLLTLAGVAATLATILFK